MRAQGFQPRIPVFGADAGIELLVHYEVVCVGQNPARRRQHVRPSGIRLNIHSNSVAPASIILFERCALHEQAYHVPAQTGCRKALSCAGR